MKSVKVMLELMSNGSVDIKTSVSDMAIVVVVLEKAKLMLLQKIVLKEESSILVPNGVN